MVLMRRGGVGMVLVRLGGEYEGVWWSGDARLC